jgi:hypothetical protein
LGELVEVGLSERCLAIELLEFLEVVYMERTVPCKSWDLILMERSTSSSISWVFPSWMSSSVSFLRCSIVFSLSAILPRSSP